MLTGVRALAAYTVFVHHQPAVTGSFWALFKDQLFIGVTVFFVLSGFLITLRYYDRVDFTARWLLGYLRRRIARIYPLYLLLTCLTFVLMQRWPALYADPVWLRSIHWDKPVVIFLNLTFLRGFFFNIHLSGIAQGWTLTVEECFYLAAPSLFLAFRRSKWILLAAPILMALFGTGLVVLLSPGHTYGLFSDQGSMLYITFFGRSFEFICGMVLALHVRKAPSLTAHGIARTAGGFLWIGGCIGALMAIGATFQNTHEGVPYLLAINNVVLPIGVALFFYGLLCERSWLRTLLETPLLGELGKSSYAFYLIHIGVFNALLVHFLTPNPYLRFAVLLVLAWALYRFIEHPMHGLLAGRKKLTLPAPQSMLLQHSQ